MTSAAFARAQEAYDYRSPPEDYYGWMECEDCNGVGCELCDFEGGGTEHEAMSLYEYRRRQKKAQEESKCD